MSNDAEADQIQQQLSDDNNADIDENDDDDQQGIAAFLGKGLNRTIQIGKNLGNNFVKIGKNLTDGPATFLQGFTGVSAGLNQAADGLDDLSNWKFKQGYQRLSNGLKNLPGHMVSMGVGGLRTGLGLGAASATIGGAGYLWKKNKNSTLYKTYQQIKQDRANKGLTDLALKILQQKGQQYEQKYKQDVDKVIGYTQNKFYRGIGGLKDISGKLLTKVQEYSEDKASSAINAIKNKFSKGGKFAEQKQKQPGFMLNVQNKQNPQPQDIGKINKV